MEILIGLAVAFCFILLWLNALATLAIKYDHTLVQFQKVAQFIFVWIIPFIGAGVVLRIVYEHSPETIPRNWIPWPFKNLIYGNPVKLNRNRDDQGPPGSGPSGGSDQHFDGGDGGGGGD